MTTINGSAGENWLSYCEAIINKGAEFYDETERIVELLDVFLVFNEFDEHDQILTKYADQKLIDLYREKMISTEIIPELNSSYGKRLYDQLGVNQVAWLVKRLKAKPETKAATISLLLPDDPGPRIPCLSVVDIKIRNEKLVLTGFFRSQNAYKSYGNFIGVRDLQCKIAQEVGYEVGDLKLYVSSAHIYKKDIAAVKSILHNSKAK